MTSESERTTHAVRTFSSSSLTLGAVILPSIVALFVACSAGGAESTATVHQEQISDISSMVQLPNGTFDVTCKDGRHENVTAAQIAQQRVCASGSPLPRGVVIYDPSDSCAIDSAVATVNAQTDCTALSTSRASSVSVDGRCIDLVPDSTIQKACLAYQPGRVVVFDPSDSCSASDAIASFNDSTDCGALSTQRASSIMVNGECIDLRPDSTVRNACLAYQPGHVVVFDPSDSCSPDNAVASFSATTDCNTQSTARASSVMVDGQCIDLRPDSTIRQACLVYRP